MNVLADVMDGWLSSVLRPRQHSIGYVGDVMECTNICTNICKHIVCTKLLDTAFHTKFLVQHPCIFISSSITNISQ